MGLFTRNSKPKAENRFSELEERLDKVERAMKALQLDWDNTYDKVRQMMGRISKRAEQLHDEAESNGKLYPAPETPPDGLPEGVPRTLTARQAAIQAQILRRRSIKPS